MLDELGTADVVIGAVLVPGAVAPTLVSRGDLARLKPGALVIDVAIDQGGCFATSHPTSYDSPTYLVDGIVHYCVANMPGAVPHTSTRALTNATLLAALGVDGALNADRGLARGLNTRDGAVTHDAVAQTLPTSRTRKGPDDDRRPGPDQLHSAELRLLRHPH